MCSQNLGVFPHIRETFVMRVEVLPCILGMACELRMVERHPLGSQAFIPMHEHPFLVCVAPDEDGRPGTPIAFQTAPGEAINFCKGTWHGVLTPLAAPGLFAVVDRIGTEANLEEHGFEKPYMITG